MGKNLNFDVRNNCGVYAITNIKTGARYIGSSSNIKKRISTHFRSLSKNCHHSKKLQRNYNKYGRECFVWDVLCVCEHSNLLIVEQDILGYYANNLNCAKSTTAPMTNKKHSIETKNFLSQIHRGNKYNVGRKASDETKLKMSISRTGLKRSEQFRNKRRQEAISDNRKVYLLDYIDKLKRPVIDNFGVEYSSMKEASIKLNISISCICDNLKGRSKKLRNGMTFKYKNVLENFK